MFKITLIGYHMYIAANMNRWTILEGFQYIFTDRFVYTPLYYNL